MLTVFTIVSVNIYNWLWHSLYLYSETMSRFLLPLLRLEIEANSILKHQRSANPSHSPEKQACHGKRRLTRPKIK
jgi:hypothetical protein